MLVSLGAAIFAVTSLSFDVEPARIAAGIVTGIGFLGAGTIIAHRGHIRGITSAATLWVVAGIGLSVGIGEYYIAIVSAIVVFVILKIEKFVKQNKNTGLKIIEFCIYEDDAYKYFQKELDTI